MIETCTHVGLYLGTVQSSSPSLTYSFVSSYPFPPLRSSELAHTAGINVAILFRKKGLSQGVFYDRYGEKKGTLLAGLLLFSGYFGIFASGHIPDASAAWIGFCLFLVGQGSHVREQFCRTSSVKLCASFLTSNHPRPASVCLMNWTISQLCGCGGCAAFVCSSSAKVCS